MYLTTLSVAPTIPTASNESVIREWCIGKDMEGSGRGLIQGTVPVFVSSNWVQPRNPSVRTAEIWTRNLPNTKKECEPLDHEVRLHGMWLQRHKHVFFRLRAAGRRLHTRRQPHGMVLLLALPMWRQQHRHVVCLARNTGGKICSAWSGDVMNNWVLLC
jgi:hypothetical protein